MRIAFFSHETQIPWLGWIAQELDRRHGCDCILWTLGKRAATLGLSHGGFDRVVDLAPSREQLESRSQEHREDVRWLRRLERRWGRPFIHEDAAQDRYFQGCPSLENDPALVSAVWGPVRVAAFLSDIGQQIEERFEDGEVEALYCEANSAPYRLARRLAELSGVPCGVVADSRLWPERIYFEPELDLVWEECRRQYDKYRRQGTPDRLRKIAEARLRQIRSSGEQPSYHEPDDVGREDLLSRLRPTHLKRHLEDWLQSSEDAWKANPRHLPPNVLSPWGRLRRYLRVVRTRNYYHREVETEPPQDCSQYAIYFLHVQPELTVESMAFEYQDQVATIRNFSATLPADMTLLVKEHLPMVGRRPRNVYAELAHLPSVKVVPATMHPHSLIKNAAVVLTLTGTAALESILYRTPALVLGEVFFSQFSGVYHATGWEEVRDLLREPENLAAASEAEAVRALAATYAASVPGLYPPAPEDNLDLSHATVDAVYEGLDG